MSRPADDGGGHGFAAEDACEVYSRSKGEWVAGVVTQVSGSRLEVEYGDRTRSVNLDDPKLDEYFRSARLRLEDAPRQLQLQDRGGRQVAEPAKRKRGGLSAILRQEPDSAFAVAQQRLQQQAHELSALQNQVILPPLHLGVERRAEIGGSWPSCRRFLALGSGLRLVGTASARR